MREGIAYCLVQCRSIKFEGWNLRCSEQSREQSEPVLNLLQQLRSLEFSMLLMKIEDKFVLGGSDTHNGINLAFLQYFFAV